MQDLDKALEDISTIKAHLAQNNLFQGFGPAVIGLTGIFALVTGVGQYILPDLLAGTDKQFLLVWIFLALFSALLVGLEMIARARRNHGGMATSMILTAIEYFLPAAMAGLIVTALLWQFSPATLWVLPGLWLFFVALGVFSAQRCLPKKIYWVGGWYFLSAICIFAISAANHDLFPWMMAVPFSLGQFLTAYILYRADSEELPPHVR